MRVFRIFSKGTRTFRLRKGGKGKSWFRLESRMSMIWVTEDSISRLERNRNCPGWSSPLLSLFSYTFETELAIEQGDC